MPGECQKSKVVKLLRGNEVGDKVRVNDGTEGIGRLLEAMMGIFLLL